MEEKKDILSNIILVNNINNDENIGALLNSVKNSQKSINQISKKIAAKEVTLKNNKKAESSPLSESDGNAEAFVAAPISQTVSNIGETPVKEIKTEISPETETVAKTNEAMVSEIKKTEAVSNEKSEKATVSAEKVSESATEPVKLEKGSEIIKSEPETVKQAAVSAKTEQTVKPFKKDIVRPEKKRDDLAPRTENRGNERKFNKDFKGGKVVNKDINANAAVGVSPTVNEENPIDEKSAKEAKIKAIDEAKARALAEARARILEQKKKEAIARGEDPNLVKLGSEKPQIRTYEPKPSYNRGDRPSYNREGRPPFNKDGRPPIKRDYTPSADGRKPFNKDGRPGGFNSYGGARTGSARPSGIVSKKPVELTFVPKDAGKTFGNKKKAGDKSYDDNKKVNKKTLLKEKVSVTDFDEDKSGYRKLRIKKGKKQEDNQTIKIEKAVINKEIIPIKELSDKLGISAIEITKRLFKEGVMKTINDSIDFDTAGLMAADLNIELELKLDKTAEDCLSEAVDDKDDELKLVKRPPVVTVMGHVDHGKTSLLDYIRKTNVAGGEAGGITQHIGAYSVHVGGERITFLDTPGHAAFTAMRARGAKITDIAVIVIAADDGIMPQTIEAINHAKAAGVSIIVAANKIDKPNADIEKIKKQLADQSVLVEDWGGEVPLVPVSAKTGLGVDKLLETILLTADLKELKANPERLAKCAIIEAKLDKGKGPVANVLVQNGTLHMGDNLVAGTITGRVRAMIDEKGRNIKEAGPSTAVSVLGLEDVPNAGDSMFAVEQDKLSKLVAEERKSKEREDMIKDQQKVSLDDLFSKISDGNLKLLNLLIKADVQGSVEAVKQSLLSLSNEEVKVNVIHAAVGAITETDIMLADSANAVIIGFNVRPDTKAKALAEKSKVDVKLYRIIYEAIDDVQKALKGMIAPKFHEIYMGKAEVREVFKITGVGMVAGSYVTEGKIVRNGKLRIYRDNVMMCEGNAMQLKRFKDDVKEVAENFECGISIENFSDIKVGDFIECYLIEQQPQQ